MCPKSQQTGREGEGSAPGDSHSEVPASSGHEVGEGEAGRGGGSVGRSRGCAGLGWGQQTSSRDERRAWPLAMGRRALHCPSVGLGFTSIMWARGTAARKYSETFSPSILHRTPISFVVQMFFLNHMLEKKMRAPCHTQFPQPALGQCPECIGLAPPRATFPRSALPTTDGPLCISWEGSGQLLGLEDSQCPP